MAADKAFQMAEIQIRRAQIREQAFRRSLRKASQQQQDRAILAIRKGDEHLLGHLNHRSA
jgi:hypothetical protein